MGDNLRLETTTGVVEARPQDSGWFSNRQSSPPTAQDTQAYTFSSAQPQVLPLKCPHYLWSVSLSKTKLICRFQLPCVGRASPWLHGDLARTQVNWKGSLSESWQNIL